MKINLILLILFASFRIFAQTDSSNKVVKMSVYLETYYTYDFSNPSNHNRPSFVYSHNRHNEVNLNLGFAKAVYEKDIVRGNLALMTGTYTQANLVAELGVLKNIFEANVKYSHSKKINIVGRCEYYKDANGVIISTNTIN